ncbi:hypothetical protein EIN_034210 [Entamoeba invadens IP1]|uniref:Uncharacterized protein n=1 Tax=Entamoeba invadens IP1 TaxID=370355 RepID=A0A0A1TYE7_ENTIV|nr:hypothetical protein EIN_034210 [Entamoeba invadens IP1]ELP86510.1 hypothetical protein EIN_034210 [Entamoeba invadens IP1]|eukprot:XP_004185856.1 hypothetical protein EIN_034210 [Entamoeba invadens IP1]
MSLFKLFASKEETLLSKALKNDNSRIPREIIIKIKEVQSDVIKSQVFTHELLKKLDAPLQPYEFLKLLTLYFIVMKKDKKNLFLSKIMTSNIQLITRIPEVYKTKEEKEIIIVFANHLDWYTTLFANQTFSLDNTISIDQISQCCSSKSCDDTIVSFFSMFFNLASIPWENERFYINKLFQFVLGFLLRELATTFFRLCCYIPVFISKLSKTPSACKADSLKYMKKFDECQILFQSILTNPNVLNYFPEAPQYNVISTQKLQGLLEARYIQIQQHLVSVSGSENQQDKYNENIQHISDEISKEYEHFLMLLTNEMGVIEYFTRLHSDSVPSTVVASRSSSKTSTRSCHIEEERAKPYFKSDRELHASIRMSPQHKGTRSSFSTNRPLSQDATVLMSSTDETSFYHFNF